MNDAANAVENHSNTEGRLVRNRRFPTNRRFLTKDIVRMSFLFPKEFYELLLFLKNETGKDMTYLVMEAVNRYARKMEKTGGKATKEGKLLKNRIFASRSAAF